MPQIQLIASDLDGTLLGHDAEASPAVRAAIAKVQARGVRVIAATGRMARSARPIVQKLGLHSPLICYQGAYVEELNSGALWKHDTMGHELTLEILGMLEGQGFQLNLYAADQMYLRGISPAAEAYMSLARVSSHQVGAWEEAFQHAAAQGATGTTKLVAIAEPSQVTQWLPELQAALGDRVHATSSLPHYLEFTAPSANKGHALRLVAEKLGVPLEATVGIGDGLNDLDLLDTAGIGIAMGQGPEALKAVAQRVALPFAEDGAALALEALMDEGLI